MTEQESLELQQRLKNILQICVQSLKPKLKTKIQIAQLQDLLLDYQNNQQLAQIIENVVKLSQKYNNKGNTLDDTKTMVEEQEYVKLENLLQTLQEKQRQYIKNQNQLKLYCEQLQTKVKELEVSKNQLVVSTKKVILDLKRDNQNLVQKLKAATSNKQMQADHLAKGRKQGHESSQRLPKSLKGSDRAESSLRSKLEQYQQVIQSIQASRGKKNYGIDYRDRQNRQIREKIKE